MKFFGDTKSLSPDMAAWVRAEDVDAKGEGAKLVSPYAQSSWVYVAVNALAQKVAQIPFRISRVGSGRVKKVRALKNSPDPMHRAFVRKAMGETIVESGDVVDLFERPHPTMDRALFWEMVVTWNALRGEFFILPLDTSDTPVDLTDRNPRVQRLITLPTELFWHIVQGYSLQAWRYTGSPLLTPIPSEILLPGEVIHSRMPNPYLFWRGMSPLLVAMVAASSDFAAAQYSKGYWLNNADTGVIVTTDQILDEGQRRAIEVALRERKRKAGTADRPLFLFGGAKVEKPQLSGMETQFLSNREMNRREIGAIWKVPESEMGFTESKASALSGGGEAINAEAVKFIESTIAPLCCRLEASVAPVVTTFGDDLIGWFDVDSLPVMQEARRARMEVGVKAFGIGATFNDINRVYDLGFPEYVWGNDSYLPFNLQKVGEAAPLPSETDDSKEEEKSNPFTRMQKLFASLKAGEVEIRKPDLSLIWEGHVNARRRTVNVFKSKITKVMNEFRRSTLAKLDEVHLEKGKAWIEVGKEISQRSLVDLIFSASEFGTSLMTELTNPMLTTLQQAGDELRQEVGADDPWKMPPRKAKEYIHRRTQPVQECGQTVRDQLNTALQEGMDEGETHKQLADRVRGVFNNLNDYEAKRIAQTEVNMAYGFSRHEAMVDSGIEYKSWLSSHGPTVRETHAEAEESTIENPIEVDEPFIVGGEELMFPGDDSLGASASNIINCHCIQLAAQKKSEDEKTITFKVFGAGELTFAKGAKS